MGNTKYEYRCTCGRCGKVFVIRTAIGPSEICDDCAQPLIDIVMGRA